MSRRSHSRYRHSNPTQISKSVRSEHTSHLAESTALTWCLTQIGVIPTHNETLRYRKLRSNFLDVNCSIVGVCGDEASDQRSRVHISQHFDSRTGSVHNSRINQARGAVLTADGKLFQRRSSVGRQGIVKLFSARSESERPLHSIFRPGTGFLPIPVCHHWTSDQKISGQFTLLRPLRLRSHGARQMQTHTAQQPARALGVANHLRSTAP